MGIIQRQSIKNSIVSYSGVIIAIFATLFIYKLDEEIYGFAHFLYSTAFLLSPIASFGITASLIKFFPSFSDRKEAYFNTILGLLIIANFVFLAFFFLFQESIFTLLVKVGIDQNNLIRQYAWAIVPLSLIINLNLLFISHASNLLRIVIPEIINNIGYKIALPIIVFAGYKGFIDKSGIAIAILFFFLMISLCLCVYLFRLGAIAFSSGVLKNTTKSFKSELAKFSLFNGFNTLGGSLAFRIDIIMISTMIGLEATGIYGIIVFLANVIEIPRKAISRIAAPIISKAWAENDIIELRTIYQKSSINLLLIGFLICFSIWFSLPFLDTISVGENRFVIYKYVFLFLSLGKLFDLMTSVNGEILIYSKDYKYNLLFLLILGCVNVILNLYLITVYGIVGAAAATCCSYFLFNLVKFLFITIKYKLTPFNNKTVLLLLIGVVVFTVVSYIPLAKDFLLNPIIRIILLALLYIPTVIYMKISPDANKILFGMIEKLRK